MSMGVSDRVKMFELVAQMQNEAQQEASRHE
jgi:hypothetical protein